MVAAVQRHGGRRRGSCVPLPSMPFQQLPVALTHATWSVPANSPSKLEATQDLRVGSIKRTTLRPLRRCAFTLRKPVGVALSGSPKFVPPRGGCQVSSSPGCRPELPRPHPGPTLALPSSSLFLQAKRP